MAAQSPRGGAEGGLTEISRLRAQVASLENERDVRARLEKLLEVQTVQVDLQKELRVKTESLLQAEQQTNSKLRQQLDDLRRTPAGAGVESHAQLEHRFREAQEHILALEKQLKETSAPETSDRVESSLRHQIDEQERLIAQLTEQMAGPAQAAPEGDVVRLQLLLQSRDKHLDELTQNVRKAQNECAEAQSEADVLRHQVRVLKKEVSERTEEMERQLNCERTLRGEVFQLQGQLEQLESRRQEEQRRHGNMAEKAATAEEVQRGAEQLERQLAEEQTTSRREREQLSAEAAHRVAAKEQVIKQQTQTIESLSRELKEKQAELDKLAHLSPAVADDQRLQLQKERGGPVPPLQPPSPVGETTQSQRSVESLHRQLRAKDAKIAKQLERVTALTEMLEKRDQQLEELSTARRDREGMQQRVQELEELVKAPPRASSHAEAERRLIEQEQRLRSQERQMRELEEELRKERSGRERVAQELEGMRGQVARGDSSSTALQEANSQLSRDLAESQRLLDARTEELRRVRGTQQGDVEVPDPTNVTNLPAMQRRLQKLEGVDKQLARDVSVWMQERENKVDSLHSTVALLRKSLEELRSGDVNQTSAPAPELGEDDGSGSPPVVAETASAPEVVRSAPPTQGVPVVADRLVTTEDLRSLSPEQIRQELVARRHDAYHFERQLEEKDQLVQRLIEEANLCNAEVASLQQSFQQAQKTLKRREREGEELLEERAVLQKKANHLQQVLQERETRLTRVFKEHMEETSGNANVDEVEEKVGWTLRVLPPRQHEIRHSVFLVLNRRHPGPLDKVILARGLAHHFAISPNRIEVVEDARLPDQERSGSPDQQDLETEDGLEGPAAAKRDLVLVNISDAEILSTDVDDGMGAVTRAAVSAIDVLDQVRNDMLRGQRIGPLDGIAVDAIFINHGDMVLPYEWPSAQAQLLLREGRALAGKHAVITVHEVRDPYTLRIVAYDREVGREFQLFLYTRDVMLLLDTRDYETANTQPDLVESDSAHGGYKHLQGPAASEFRKAFTVSEGNLLDAIISSLSFSVWQNQQILVASEMRIPSAADWQPASMNFQSQSQVLGLQTSGSIAGTIMRDQTGQSRELWQQRPLGLSTGHLLEDSVSLQVTQSALLPEVGLTRGLRPTQRETRRLFEDALGFEGRVCIFSLVHTTARDLSEDLLRATVYYPRTSSKVEAVLHEPMLADRLRIVAEAGELDSEGPLNVAIVVEEIIYPPAFLVRLTSITLTDASALSPGEASKPHSHVIRISKDGTTVTHVPDISFALSPSTIRTKLLRCIGVPGQVEAPRERALALPSLLSVTGGASAETLVKRAVSGHVDEPSGLRMQLKSLPAGRQPTEDTERGALAMPAAMRAQLRERYGRGRLLKREGRTLGVRGGKSEECVRVVVSVYDRPQPYHHLVLCAYEPQTSREWELLTDSIDVFRLFADKEAGRSQAVDLAIPSTRERIAGMLTRSAELVERDGEVMLAVSPTALREQTVKKRGKDGAAQVVGHEGGLGADMSPTVAQRVANDEFEVQPVMSRLRTRAVAGFAGGGERALEAVVDQTGRDRLFTAQRRLAPNGVGKGDLYTVQIYDAPSTVYLHSYVILAAPLHDRPLAAAGLPGALGADSTGGLQPPPPPHYRPYSLKVDDKMLEDFLWGHELLEATRQEELLHYLSQCLRLDEDKDGQFRLRLQKHKLRAHEILEALEDTGQTGAKNPAGDLPGGPGSREVGGVYPLNKLRGNAQTTGQATTGSTRGPSLTGDDDPVLRKMMSRGWQKLYCMAQRFGSASVVVTVSKREASYKLAVYEPESSAFYEMTMVTGNSSTPLTVLLERCELAGKVDLMLCMNEIAFPHQVQVVILHIPTSQEFNLKLGDDQVYTMVEASRREAFVHFFEQLISWGCIGFDCAPGTEAQFLAEVFEETFAGNQIFTRTRIGDRDPLAHNLYASVENGELKQPNALSPRPPRELRVPVVRTQLDYLGKKAPPTHGIAVHLLYHAEHVFKDEGKTLLARVHKRAFNNDVALTLKMRGSDNTLSLPGEPNRQSRSGQLESSAANGRSFRTPALGLGEAKGTETTEITIWLQDKCSRSPCGGYGEICEVPGCPRPVCIFATDEDAPRAIRVAVTLAQLPFTVLFQVVLLEASEPSAKLETGWAMKPSASHRVMQQTFARYFGRKTSHSPAVITHLNDTAANERDQDLRQRVDEIEAADRPPDHIGFEFGEGVGGPLAEDRQASADEPVNVSIVFMCTRKKLGRMMVFTVYRDLISTKMYLRVVMHDPVAKRDSHLTLLHFATMRLLSSLRLSRDMLEECGEMEHESVKYQRQQHRAEFGKLIVDHLFLQRVIDKEGNTEEIDNLEMPDDDEEVDYELRMRDIQYGHLPSEAAKLSQQVLEEAVNARSISAEEAALMGMPKTLLGAREEHLLHKGEKVVAGRRVLVAFFNETTKEDILKYSHNVRIVVADVQSLEVLVAKDFHEDTLEQICARRGKRHLMSAAREQDLVKELWQCLSLEQKGFEVTGIAFTGMD